MLLGQFKALSGKNMVFSYNKFRSIKICILKMVSLYLKYI
jgi:hypothetical protein